MLTITNLTAGYGKLHILHELSLQVAPGQFVAILGPNGSGKSTLLKSIFGLTQIFGGDVQLVGHSLLPLPTEQIGAQGIAYVPQRANLFTTLTVRENLQLAVRRLGRTEATARLQEAYTLFPILAEKQMVAIALGWLGQPRMMLLDEPSAGLAPIVVTEVFKTLRTLCDSGITLVVVEQNARSLLRWCDYAYVLREGRIAFGGTAAELLADEATAKGYLGVGHGDTVKR